MRIESVAGFKEQQAAACGGIYDNEGCGVESASQMIRCLDVSWGERNDMHHYHFSPPISKDNFKCFSAFSCCLLLTHYQKRLVRESYR